MSPVPSAAIGRTLRARADDDRPALLFGDQRWSYREVVEEGRRRAAILTDRLDPDRPPHVGVLLDNTPEHVFWLVGAALSGAVVVGINSTYRGAPLAQLIDHTDCQVLVTSSDLAPLLDGADHGVAPERTLVVDTAAHERLVAATEPLPLTGPGPADDDLMTLIFTSGSTGLPKAVRCTQGRIGRTGAHVAAITALGPDDVIYAPLPLFHAASLFTGWAAAVHAGIPLATRPRFSTSGTLGDLRRFGATVMTYTGKVLGYVLTTPESPDDARLPLRLAIGNEASEHDIRAFARRFDCQVRDSYGSTEGVIIVRRDPSMPPGALGRADDTVLVLDPDTGRECPRVRRDAEGRATNLDEAVGEMVETRPSRAFEGYYGNEAATRERFRDGAYWSGDLAYRDDDGWLFFAGRSNDWLRVDGENFAAGPVEAIVDRHPAVRQAAVYAVPDDPVGDRVMVAVELHDGADLDAGELDRFLDGQPDLGPKWRPAFVRIDERLPRLSSLKVDKKALRRDAWGAPRVLWRPARGDGLRALTDADRARLDPLLRGAGGAAPDQEVAATP